MSAKPVLLVTGCRKYEEYLHAAIRRMTRPEWEVIGIVGDGTKAVLNNETRILTLAVPDTYEALPTKIHAAFTWIAENRPGIPGVFKTDDDLLFDMNALAKTVQANLAQPYWGVAAGVCKAAPVNPARIAYRFNDTSLKPSHQTAAYCFGWGYWISKDMIPHIVAAATDYQTSYLEDVCTGYVLNQKGVTPVRILIPYKECPRVPGLLAIK